MNEAYLYFFPENYGIWDLKEIICLLPFCDINMSLWRCIVIWGADLMSNDEYKNCPYCDEEIKAIAVKCRYCQSMLIDEKNKL